MRTLRPTATAVAGILLLALSACVPGAATPTPTPSAASGTPAPSEPPQTPVAEEIEVTAAVVVVTSTTTSVFGTDGTTLASVDYSMDAAAAAAELAEALGEAPVVTAIPEVGASCAGATGYDFGGLLLRSPGSLGSTAPNEVMVTGATTSGGVGIETIAAQRIGAEQASFEAAVGDFIRLYESDTILGFDIVNPEAGGWDRIGIYAEFAGGELVYLATPHQLGVIADCG